CVRVLKPGGLLLLSEATVQGWKSLNLMRHEFGLPPIPVPAFNEYLDEEAVVAAVEPELELEAITDFASTYYVGTRVLKPLIALMLEERGVRLDVADPNSQWNRWCAQLPAFGDYG